MQEHRSTSPLSVGWEPWATELNKTAATARERLETVGAADVAATLQALATPHGCASWPASRRAPARSTELADAVGMEQSACSHQLRLLRNLGLVTGERRGRSVIYALYDNHVAELLEQALYHVEHLRLGLRDSAGAAITPTTAG